jgi:hypothetical protein
MDAPRAGHGQRHADRFALIEALLPAQPGQHQHLHRRRGDNQ